MDSENDTKIIGKLGFDTNNIITSRLKKVDTWQPSRTLEWVSISRNSIEGPKSFGIQAHLKKGTQPDLSYTLNLKKYFNIWNSTEISIEFRLKYDLPPAQKK